MKKILFILVVLLTTFSFAQNKPSVLISRKYEFQKSDNSYNLNNMFKGILSSSCNVYFENDELPIEIGQNKCNAYSGFLVENSNMFTTKMKFVIKDCQNNVVFESAEMKSKEKDYQLAYNEVMRLLVPEVKKFALTRPTIKKETPVVVDVKPIETKTVEIKSEGTTSNVSKYTLLEIQNGFAILDASPKVVLQIYKTSNPSVFIADKFGVKGIFTKVENKGFFEYYLNDKLIVEEYQF
ncbi:hypothetical protein [Flavobacterium urocaniciphilum]|uniref:Uncharacterized protein n=1 Tax=Flavobacterium urocaniciphilum TaxID=1299341 RepID=A0A1H9C6W7_9FLAO|nr:hypothetical protein [Flavobacterium urocaniciphilum]SEP96721.1 hypothetical protein SAMN05444005_10469 [Flavobacterium urocaniciphilum]